MKTFIIILKFVLLFYSITIINAQEDYKKWLEKENSKYQKYIDEQDKKFVEFLKKEWKNFNLMQGNEFYTSPKLKKIPKLEPEDPKQEPFLEDKNEEKTIENKNKQTSKSPEETKQPDQDVNEETIPKSLNKEKEASEPKQEQEEPNKSPNENRVKPAPEPVEDTNMEPINFKFYGKKDEISLPENYKIEISKPFNNNKIADFWGEMAAKKFDGLLRHLQNKKDRMNLNDWGYFLFIKEIANNVYPNSPNKKHLFMWYMIVKSGYKARVGLVSNKVYLFIPAENKIYGVPYIRSAGSDNRSYIMDFDNLWQTSLSGKRISSYDDDYPASNKLLNMNLHNPPKIDTKLKSKTLRFRYKGRKYEIPVKYNISAIDFYEYYPYSNLEIYFNAGVSEETKESLLKSLRPVVENENEAIAANKLLRFVQNAFDYKMDQPHFGREKPLFVEETLHYDYSDCEDRSIMYAFLVEELLGLEVIGVRYPGHLATAVNFNINVEGDNIKHNGREYTVCDPTYVNANIGMTMPRFKGKPLKGILEFH